MKKNNNNKIKKNSKNNYFKMNNLSHFLDKLMENNFLKITAILRNSKKNYNIQLNHKELM